MRYRTIVADPPWHYPFGHPAREHKKHPYPTMTLGELCELAGVWRDARLVGVRLEREATERAEAWKASRAAMASTKSPSKSVESTAESASLGGKAHEQSADDDFPPPQNSGAAEAGTSSAGSGTPASGVPAPEHHPKETP